MFSALIFPSRRYRRAAAAAAVAVVLDRILIRYATEWLSPQTVILVGLMYS